MAVDNLTAERLRTLLSYDEATGVFRWKQVEASLARRKKGEVAGCFDANKYVIIGIGYKRYKAHRLAWLYVYGCWPKRMLDHIDGNPSNNRIDNLREATAVMNAQNQRRAHKRNMSGLLGAAWNKNTKRFHAAISINSKLKHLGCFKTAEEAHEKYLQAKSVVHAGYVAAV